MPHASLDSMAPLTAPLRAVQRTFSKEALERAILVNLSAEVIEETLNPNIHSQGSAADDAQMMCGTRACNCNK